jgi:uncharacterized protein (DUF58 family)
VFRRLSVKSPAELKGAILRLYHRASGPVWRFHRADCVSTIRIRQALPFVAFVVVTAWYIAAPSAMSVMGLVTLGGLLLSAYLWVRSMAKGVIARRHLRYAAFQVGDELEEEIRLTNQSALPVLWAEFSDHSSIPGYTVTGVRATGGKSFLEWRATTICSRRGVYTLGPWELAMGDPFGIFRLTQVYSQCIEILVYPPLAALPKALLPLNKTVGDQRSLRQPLSAETIKASTTRPYLPGDPLRHIHWATTARRGATFVKQFDPEASSTAWLIPDFDAGVQLGEGDESTEETLAILAASLAAQLLREHIAVGLLTWTDRLQVAPPQHGQAYLWELLRAIAPLRATPGRPLSQLLAQARPLVSGRDMLVTITPSLDPSWPDELLRISRSQGGSGMQAILLDPASFGGKQSAGEFESALVEMGILARVIRQGEIQPVNAVYGALRRWEFVTLGTGRVFVRQTPRQAPDRPGAGIVPGL